MRPYRRCAFLLLFALAWTSPALAQSGSILGTLRDMDDGSPVGGAQVSLRGPGGIVAETLSGDNGRFILQNIAAGNYSVVVEVIGYQTFRRENVSVRPGQTLTLELVLPKQSFQLNPIIVSASKRQEKVLEAPATVAVVNAAAIREQVALSPMEHLRDVPGVDIMQQGVQSSNVVARGFNNVFSGSLHMLTDYRIASVPSLRVNLMHFIPSTNEDIERIEVVLGPGSALYGPGTASGVLHMLTRSPFDDPGTSVSVGAGMRANQEEFDRGFADRWAAMTSFRTAHVLGEEQNFGVKLSGQFLEANDWIYVDPVERAARNVAVNFDPDTNIGLRDYGVTRWSYEARADWRATEDLTAVFTHGRTNAGSSIELTGLGAGQAVNWSNSFYQLRATKDRWFGQFYLNASNAGDTYLLRDGASIIDDSKMVVGQLQHGAELGGTNLTYGFDLLHTMPDTEGTIHGENEDDDNVTEMGGYLQAEIPFGDKVEFVLAGRADKHSHVDHVVFSPRAAVVFSPVPEQTFRVTYNRAFSSPSTINLFLDLGAGLAPPPLSFLGYQIRAQGTGSDGYNFLNNGQLTGMRSPYAAAVGQTAGDLLTADPATMWLLAIQAAESLVSISLDPTVADELRGFIPGASDLGFLMRDLTTGQIVPMSQLPDSYFRMRPIEESITQTFEVGYKGILGDRVLLAADAWYENRSDFVSPLIPVTPLIQLDPEDLEAWLVTQFTNAGDPDPAGRAAALAPVLGAIPAAVVSSNDVNNSGAADLLVTYQNFGQVDLWGADLSATAILTDHWQLGVSGSLVSDDHFCVGADGEVDQSECVGGAGRLVALNAPEHKASTRLNYRNPDNGMNGEFRARWTSSFPANSAAFVGTDCVLAGDAQGNGECVESALLFDLNLGYRFGETGISAQLSIQNLLNTPYRSFVGVPELGMFSMMRLTYEF